MSQGRAIKAPKRGPRTAPNHYLSDYNAKIRSQAIWRNKTSD